MAETTRSETFLEALKGIQDALAAFQGIALELFITLAGVGVLTMAVLQLLKELLPVRRWYQQYQFRKWLGERIRKVRLSQSKHYEPEGLRIRDQAYEDILKLSMSGDEKALFELPPGQLVGQMGIASQLVLDHPEQYESAFTALTVMAEKDDIGVLQNGLIVLPEDKMRYTDARNRVAAQIQRSLDQIQIIITRKWKRAMHWVSVLVSGIILYATVKIFNPSVIDDANEGMIWIAITIVGAFIAPVAHDMVSTLKKFRVRS